MGEPDYGIDIDFDQGEVTGKRCGFEQIPDGVAGIVDEDADGELVLLHPIKDALRGIGAGKVGREVKAADAKGA